MVLRKKPVGRQPIHSAERIRQIDPIWMPGPVPFRFWQDPARRRDYLRWLGHRLHFRYVEDFYRLTHKDIKRNYGAGLAVTYWHDSPVEGVKECFPEYEWHEWLFTKVPLRFWQKKENRRRYLRWLGARLGFHRPEDWYAVKRSHFAANCGAECVKHYGGCPAVTAMDLFPDYPWEEWRFQKGPRGFWHCRENRERYMVWLGRMLGFRRPEDWRRVRWEDFRANYGSGLLFLYGPPRRLLRECFPRVDWHNMAPKHGRLSPVTRRPPRYQLCKRRARPRRSPLSIPLILGWADAYRRRTGRWPGPYSHKLDGEPDMSWTAIDAALREGRHGLRAGGSLPRLLAKYRGVPNRLARPRLSIRKIFRWAVWHHRRTGQWPTSQSGPVEGTVSATWCGINRALIGGYRGLPGGSSLPRLLEEKCGVRNRRHLPRLTEPKILAWARAYRRAHGNWPQHRAGPVAQSPGDTWSAINSALSVGNRGLRGGSSLAKLLRKHGLK